MQDAWPGCISLHNRVDGWEHGKLLHLPTPPWSTLETAGQTPQAGMAFLRLRLGGRMRFASVAAVAEGVEGSSSWAMTHARAIHVADPQPTLYIRHRRAAGKLRLCPARGLDLTFIGTAQITASQNPSWAHAGSVHCEESGAARACRPHDVDICVLATPKLALHLPRQQTNRAQIKRRKPSCPFRDLHHLF
jgi:hypothetical protein